MNMGTRDMDREQVVAKIIKGADNFSSTHTGKLSGTHREQWIGRLPLRNIHRAELGRHGVQTQRLSQSHSIERKKRFLL